MIKQLEEYCSIWDISVKDKFKIIIFRKNEGRLGKSESWKYMGKQIEVVKEYTYLGIKMTPTLNMKLYIKDKLSADKAAMNGTWGSILGRKDNDLLCQTESINATVRTIFSYGQRPGHIMSMKKLKSY